jgi:hypothetical protein
MKKIINTLIGLVGGVIFSILLISVLTVFFVVLLPFLFYFTVREVLKYLTTTK